jgi:carnitine-CoA ligase
MEAAMSSTEPLTVTLARHAADVPDRVFIEAMRKRITYAETDDMARRVASSLRSRGLEPGARVAYLSEYRVEIVGALFGVALAGAVNVVLNIFLRGDFLIHQLVDSGSDTVVVDQVGWENLVPVLPALSDLRRVVVLDRIPPGSTALLPAGVELLRFDDLTAAEPARFEADRAPERPFGFVYTSGTTGMPKACVLSEAYVRRTGEVYAAAWGAQEADVIFTATPIYHISGYIGIMTALLKRGSLVNDSPFSASTYIARAAEVRATIAYGVGFHSLAVLRQPERPTDRDHCLRFGWFGPFPAELRAEFEQRYGFEVLSEMYAQTECSLVAYGRMGAEPRKFGTCGIAASDIELALVDDDDNPVPVGEQGEIVVRPRRPGAVFSGYWQRGEATAALWRNLWHHTGDVGRLDADGFLSFVDRKVDSIRRRGEMVSAFQLEAAIMRHPQVAEVAVHAVNVGSEVDQSIKACLVLRPDESLDPAELAAWFARELPYFASPRFVEVMPALPKNASGRVMKYELRDRPDTEAVWDLDAMGLQVPREDRRRSGASA